MPKKLNYDYVKKYIEENSKGECKLISQDYINNNTPLVLQCKCGNIFERTFNKIKLNRFKCNDCKNIDISKKYSFNIDEIKLKIKEKGCEYIEGTYKNNSSKLTLKCKCGNIFVKDFNHFMRGQNRCPECGKESSRQSKFKYDLEKVEVILSQKGYKVLQDCYVDCMTPIKCKCPKGHYVNIKLSAFFNNNSGCKICANENLKGENNWNYKGGESELIDYLRKSLKDWKVNIMKKYNNKCYLTSSSRDCVIHHIKSFNTIVSETLKELNLPLYRKINNYSNDELKSIINLFLKKHTLENGVLLQRKTHNKFHSLYGKGNNTKEQFNDFIIKYYPHVKTI